MTSTECIQGTIASQGYAYGQAFLWREGPVRLKPGAEKATDCSHEVKRLNQALATVRRHIQDVQDKAETLFDEATQALFESYQMLLDDEELLETITDLMERESIRAEYAVHRVMEDHARAISLLDNPYLKERATDIRDLSQRILKELLGIVPGPLPDLTDRILVAEDLSPAQSVQLNLHTLQGLLTDLGGTTSHTSILARALNIPAIVGTRHATRMIQNSDWVLMDAVSNRVYVNPDPELVQLYEASRARHQEEHKRLAELVHVPAQTLDGHAITLAANIGLPEEIPAACKTGAQGIGLFRTEFLFMNRSNLPDEEEQFATYRSALVQMHPHAVIVRTMDVGGDKDLPHLGLPKEDNPFLGLRGIRVSLRRPELLRTQFRALLRASAYGSLKIMCPMIATVEEIIEVRSVLQDVREELTAEGISIASHVDLGIMIETPASVMLAHQLIRYVDFFSIGTNDLTQYTLAVDRGNIEIRDLYQPYAPAVLLMIHQAIRAAIGAGKWAGVCGELAGDPRAALLLIGFGATELSMSAGSIARVKQALIQTHHHELKEWSEKALQCATAAEVSTLLEALRSHIFQD
ncbi:phosphoenolpyruvate--protein phosphotransferase [Oligoflexus tunisiensis]|uniref:phosphoenolpyruvate--protein phosphotransferase n=1 Tax=Oligoflexus tunisiensis TaxID=708132 RepID=UPI000ACCDA41|nr:phosphoenolpyruvate--protein phosphotransferase [Oligoflexus tunisiensis]